MVTDFYAAAFVWTNAIENLLAINLAMAIATHLPTKLDLYRSHFSSKFVSLT